MDFLMLGLILVLVAGVRLLATFCDKQIQK